MGGYQVTLPEFEGPLDLLLSLIHTHKLDICDIPIAFITEKYMDYLKQAGEIDLEMCGEFIVMVGTLLAIKARMLLPKRPADEDAEDEADPRDPLVEQLRAREEYLLYKEKSLELKELYAAQALIHYRAVDDSQLLRLFPPPNPVGDLSADDLRSIFQQVLAAWAAREETIVVPREVISLRQQMNAWLSLLARRPGGVELRDFLAGRQGRRLSHLITAFMSLLELLHKGLIRVRQERPFGGIYVFPRETPGKEPPVYEPVLPGN
ncbi:MAG: segregation/condensation protein A [Peptococcaceae bacterium]|jgi:segregation and condensation protein A|nr:segregation/condensation protein A [Peptococcaceae bacterium]